MEKELTFCKNCKHSICKSRGSDIWYNWVCGASERKPAVDVVTGKSGFEGVNDLGTKYVTDEQYLYCRDVNDGNCKKYSQGVA